MDVLYKYLRKQDLFFFFFVLNVAVNNGFSQFYSRGEEPEGLKWKQINTDHFKVIFPADFDSTARRITHNLEFYYLQNSAFLSHQPRKIPVVLHNHSVVSNGFVAWAPKRMELVTTPPPDSYPQDYTEQLVLHEFRHVVQVDKLNQGVTRALRYIIGEQGQGAIAGYLPFWFLEGDAVDAETKLSKTGRGRLPSFEKEIKALLLEKNKLYPYEKAVFGSYKDFVPTHYHYGYQMVAYGRSKFGDDLWANMVDYTARHPYYFFPFYFGLKKYAGLSKTGLYKETFNTLKKHWTETAQTRHYSAYEIINKKDRKYYTSYNFPHYLNDSLIFAEKSGVDQLNEFILIDLDGREKKIHVTGYNDPVNISVSGHRVTWAEIIYDERWDRRSYSIVKIFDINSGREKILTRRTRYFSPDLSTDSKKIVVTEVNTINEYFLVFLDAESGKAIIRIKSPENQFLQYPVWSKDGSRIYVSALGPEGKKIMEYHVSTGLWKVIFNSGFEDIAEFCAGKEYLFFRGTFSGIDNIYALHLETSQCFRVTSSHFGAFYPALSPDEDKIIYSDYSSYGFNIVETEISPAVWETLEKIKDHYEQLNAPAAEQVEQVRSPALEPLPSYEGKSFHKINNIIHIHSWAPFYYDFTNPDLENPAVSPGITLLSQDLLSTAFASVGYEYNLDQKDHFLHTSIIWKGWYPVIKLSYDFGGYPFIAEHPEGVNALQQVKTNINLNLEISIPLNFTRNKYIRGMQPSIETRHQRAYLYYQDPGEYRAGLTFIDYRFYAYNYLQLGHKDILPRWGQVLDLRFYNAPFQKDQIGSQSIIQGTLYLPGILNHNTLKVKGGFMKQETSKYILQNGLVMPRGYNKVSSEQFGLFTLDYVCPFLYPDLRIWHVLYIKRIKADIFYDYGYGVNVLIETDDKTDKINTKYQSIGCELTADFHPAQFLFPINAGVRYIYLPGEKRSLTEAVFSVDLSRF